MSEAKSPVLAVFDFDGTISDRDSFLAFIRHTHGSWRFFWGFLLHLPYLILYLLGRYPNDLIKEKIFTHFYAGKTEEELAQQGKQFCEQKLPALIYAGARQQLQWHQQQGHRIIILTASSAIWLKPWCDANHFEIIATTFETQNGRYTGNLQGENCYGEEKRKRIASVLSNAPSSEVYGYGDRTSDQAFLKECDHISTLPLTSSLTGCAGFSSHSCGHSGGSQSGAPLLYRAIRYAYLALFLSLPFSVPVDFYQHQVNVPSEPLLILISILLAMWFFTQGWWSRTFYRQPISIVTILMLLWLFVITIFTTLPLVSAKYFLVTFLHWWVFYHGLPLLFDQRPKALLRFVQQYAASFLFILLFAWTVHAQYDFRIDASVLTARPFYFDHGLYSSCLLLLLGPVFGLFIISYFHKTQGSFPYHWLWLVLSGLFTVGIYLSFSRAAWLSCLMSLVLVAVIMLFRPRFKTIVYTFIVLMLGLLLTGPYLISKMGNNKNTGRTDNQWEHLSSVTNLTTDVSNLERLNRYSCAWRMFQDRPVTGFGIGTFQFAYLKYQRHEEMTRLSVTSPGKHRAGMGGGAHSEYFQLLAEAGLPALLLWIALLFAVLWTVTQINHSSPSSWQSTLSLGICFSLLTYFIHGLFNNFLHYDKVAALFWGLLTVLTYLQTHKSMATI
ncbi:HAD-IB family hydrolase [Lewinella sp. LCG006]|uniref:HAD-IB family hydrolase n=1 Tax=Lewinella sp. LCG006 TaxID=3231911 RepID=UPI0034613EA4